MGIKKIILPSVISLILVTFLSAQSLVELAKKEKERRAKLKGKKSILVTNADLKNMKKKPAVSIPESQLAEIKRRASQSPAQSQPSRNRNIDRESQESLSRLETNWKKADEYVELLTLKINGLQQKFYTFRDWTLRDSIQREIRDTYQKLQEAQEDAKKAKEEYEKKRIRRQR